MCDQKKKKKNIKAAISKHEPRSSIKSSIKPAQRRIFALSNAQLVQVDKETIGLLHEMHCNKMESKNEDTYERRKLFSGGDIGSYQWSAPTPSTNNIPVNKKTNFSGNKIVTEIMNEYVEKLRANDPDINSIFHTVCSDKKINRDTEIGEKQDGTYKILFEEVFSRLTDIQIKEIKEASQVITQRAPK